ncbi:MAG: pyridoxamine 5'-phosphate oxidase [Devosiaceae bacterium]|nr:pyridoxamine 5'-phosphate oxidase [Devosiaceae bacterium]
MDVFSQWLLEARLEEVNDANAMSLATVDADGMPDCRIMLLNGQDEKGFFFYTNTRSAKGAELEANPKAALLFYWKSLQRQVRIRGAVVDLSPEQSDAYFATRPRGSQIGAHASFQSHPIVDQNEFQARIEQLEKDFEGRDVPRPGHWRGFRVEPIQIEFWKKGEFRIHDRIVFRRETTEQPWVAQRLHP